MNPRSVYLQVAARGLFLMISFLIFDHVHVSFASEMNIKFLVSMHRFEQERRYKWKFHLKEQIITSCKLLMRPAAINFLYLMLLV